MTLPRSLPLLALLLAALLEVGCAAKRTPKPPGLDSPPTSLEDPAWVTPEGRDGARAELVEALLDSGQPEAALKVLNEMRASGVEGDALDILQARALSNIGLYEDAEQMLEDVRARSRRNPEVYNQLGVLYLDQKRLDEAIRHFTRAHRLDKDVAEYANNLGFALMTGGQPGEAVEVLRVALQADATRMRTRNNLGFALMADGRPEEAYRVFRSATTEDEARYNLGVGYELTGQTQQATDAYEAALRANPEHSLAQQALQRLQSPSLNPTPEERP